VPTDPNHTSSTFYLLFVGAALVAVGMAGPPLVSDRVWRFVCWSAALVVLVGVFIVRHTIPAPTGLLVMVLAILLLAAGFVVESRREQVIPVVETSMDTTAPQATEVVADPLSADSAPERPSIEETAQLAEQFTKTSKAIYAFLNRHAARTDEAKVVAEYRQKFDAKVTNLCFDLIEVGLATTDGLKNALKPPSSLDDIQWIARILATTGHGYSAERLEKYRALALGELTKAKLPHKFSCPPHPRVEALVTARPDAIEVDTTRCLECGAESHLILCPPELHPFFDKYVSSDSDETVFAALENWMEQASIPESKRDQLRERTEAYLKAVLEDAPFALPDAETASEESEPPE
jgi:hypothetical protein